MYHMTHDTSHAIRPVKADDPDAFDHWHVEEGKRCVRVTEAYRSQIRRARADYPACLVRDALDKLPTEGPTRVKNAYKALAHVVMAALRQFAVDAEVPGELLFLARSRYWEFLCGREVDATFRKKLVVTFSECPEGDTVTNFTHEYNGTRCKHSGESLDVSEPASFRPSPRLVPSDFSSTAVQQNKWWQFLEAAHPECHFGALDIAGRQAGCRGSCSTVEGERSAYRSCTSVRKGELEIFDFVTEVLFTAANSLGIEIAHMVCLGHSVDANRVLRIARGVRSINSPEAARRFPPLQCTSVAHVNHTKVARANHWYVAQADFPRLSPDSFVLTDDPSLLMTSQVIPDDRVS